MATATQNETLEDGSLDTDFEGESRVVIHGVDYEFYKRFCDEIGEQPVRLSFSDECLEIMNTHLPHEFYKTVLAKLVEAIFLEQNTRIRSGGTVTIQHDAKKKGFEPDECWWIAHEPEIRGKSKLDFRSDPPPDLAIEIEMSRSLVGRIGIYAAIGIPEVWRFNGKRLRFCLLNSGGEYEDSESSLAFPFLKTADLLPYLGPLDDPMDETSRVRNFVNWLRSLPQSL